MDKKLLLWDIDGTLMSCGDDGTKAFNETFKKLYGFNDAFGEIKVGTALDSVILEKMMNHFKIEEIEKPRIINTFASTLEEILNANINKHILPGINEILADLCSHEKVYMGLSTSNFKIGADIKLKSVGLTQYFSFGGYGDISGEKWDAAAAAILYAEGLSNTSFKKSDIYLIGDTWYDIKCAEKLGIKSVAVGTGWTKYEDLRAANPDYLFWNFENHKNFLDIVKADI